MLTESGDLWTWGANAGCLMGDGSEWVGILGDGTSEDQHHPTLILQNVATFTSTGFGGTATLVDGSIWVWPNDVTNFPHITSYQNAPVKILDYESYSMHPSSPTLKCEKSAFGFFIPTDLCRRRRRHGITHEKFIKYNTCHHDGDFVGFWLQDCGRLWGFGDNVSGMVGAGIAWDLYNNSTHTLPLTLIMHDVIDVQVGHSSVFALQSNGMVWGWGSNFMGQLGDGTTITRYAPVLILENAVSLAVSQRTNPYANAGHTLAILEDGSLWAWGANDFGQIGDGSTISRKYPVQIWRIAA